ncbi:MAG: hypothetical protein NWQ09_07350 [Nonlabens sp.]|jgi:cobalamin synthase|nr:hypothetical protein [Nonlabens sp.]MDP5101125.1 hypothetical protein [Nonlabens sp.]
MNKFYKYFQFAYLAFAILFIVSGILEYSNNANRAYMMFAMAAVAIFMFFFKRHFSRKFENKK